MQPIFVVLSLVEMNKYQPRCQISFASDLNFFLGRINDNPAKSLYPPHCERNRVLGVNDHLLPFKTHGEILKGPSGAVKVPN